MAIDSTYILLALSLSYLAVGWRSVWYDFKRPFFMPFGMFKLVCLIGRKASLTKLPEGMDGLQKWGFVDPNYQKWFEQVMASGTVTRLQLNCFNQQRLTEIDAELERRGINKK